MKVKYVTLNEKPLRDDCPCHVYATEQVACVGLVGLLHFTYVSFCPPLCNFPICHFVTLLPCNPTYVSLCNCVNLSLFTLSPCHYPCCHVTVLVCHFVTHCCSLILHLTLEGGLSTVMSMLTVLPDPEVQPSALKLLLAVVTAEE